MRTFLLLISSLFLLIWGKRIAVEENDAIQKECKPIHVTRVKRVLYGDKIDNDQMKYVVNVQIGTDEGSSRCSGTIISPKHILTAGHCFYDKAMCNKTKDMSVLFPKKRTFVHFGGNCITLAASGSCAGGVLNQRIEATQVMVPVKYAESGCSDGDIAIVEVKDAFPVDLGFACLPTAKRKLVGRVFAAGYGTDPGDPDAPQKFKERAEFMAEKYCDFSLRAPKDRFCTEENKQFLCKGDSGSGILRLLENKPTIFGVHSAGTICAKVKTFVDNPLTGRRFRGSMNTDVRKYLRWICGNTGVCPPGLNRKEAGIKKKTIQVI